MRSNEVGDAADAEVGAAFGSASASPLARQLGITPQMESEWDEEESEPPNITVGFCKGYSLVSRCYSTSNVSP